MMVGTAGFELATPCTPCKCATRLRYAPNPLIVANPYAGRQTWFTPKAGGDGQRRRSSVCTKSARIACRSAADSSVTSSTDACTP
jgi:hypothetical protein